MEFKHANDLACRVGQGQNSGLYETLVQMCIPYLLGVQRRFDLKGIPTSKVRNELAPAAISRCIAETKLRNVPFTAALQNTFRDICREEYRSTRKLMVKDMIEKCSVAMPATVLGTAWKRPSPDIQAQRNEELDILRRLLKNHGKASKMAIYERMRGSPYAEIAQILDKKPKQCRALFSHDIRSIRDDLNDYRADDECR